MRKQWIALACTVALSAGALTAAHAATYSDVDGNWAQSDINTVVDMSVMSGFNDGMFHPDAWVTRAEFSNMAAKALGLQPSKADQIQSLKNVSRNNWSFSNLDNQNWISTYPAGVYRPANPLRRVEALASLAGTLNKPLVSSSEADQILSQYTDADQIPSGVRRDVATAIKYNLYEEDPKYGTNTIDPLRPATRAEVASLLNDLYQNRDISLVQNGQVIASTYQGGTTTASETTTTTPSMTSTASTGTMGNDQPLPFKRPFRNSADTIPEMRMVNQTTTPTTLDATATSNLPSNVTFTGTVAKALYSEFNKPGDPVVVILDHAIIGNDGTVAVPAGSKMLGNVTDVVSNNSTGDNAQLGVAFKEFVTPSGQRIPVTATVANNDGILKAGEIQGLVFHPNHSTAALKREIHTAEGGMYGTKIGKAEVLDEPYATQVSDRPLDPMDKSHSDIVIGVGDIIQLRLGSASTSQ